MRSYIDLKYHTSSSLLKLAVATITLILFTLVFKAFAIPPPTAHYKPVLPQLSAI